MSRPAWHAVLESPAVYAAVQRVLGGTGGAFHRSFGSLLADAQGTVLDVGCGPAPDMPPRTGTLVGLDVNPRYVRRYVENGGRRVDGPSIRGVVGSAEELPFADASFDECRSVATLHHVPDRVASRAVREMYRAVRPGGRLAIFDMVRPRSVASSPVGRLVCRLDRGRWVRSEEHLVHLVRDACRGPWEIHGFWYSWVRLRGCVLLLHKP